MVGTWIVLMIPVTFLIRRLQTHSHDYAKRHFPRLNPKIVQHCICLLVGALLVPLLAAFFFQFTPKEISELKAFVTLSGNK